VKDWPKGTVTAGLKRYTGNPKRDGRGQLDFPVIGSDRNVGGLAEALATARKHRNLIEGILNRWLSQGGSDMPDQLLREVVEEYRMSGWERLRKCAEAYDLNHPTKATFVTFAVPPLWWQLRQTVRKVLDRNGLDLGVTGGWQPDMQIDPKPSYWGTQDAEMGTDGDDVGDGDPWNAIVVDADGANAARLGEITIARSDGAITEMFERIGLRPDRGPSLTTLEAVSVGLFLWGEHLDEAREMWQLDLFHLMATTLLAEGAHPSGGDIAGVINTRYPGLGEKRATRQSVNRLLDRASVKVGVRDRDALRGAAVHGCIATALRLELMAREGRYFGPKRDALRFIYGSEGMEGMDGATIDGGGGPYAPASHDTRHLPIIPAHLSSARRPISIESYQRVKAARNVKKSA
jgi:hypothetical protein